MFLNQLIIIFQHKDILVKENIYLPDDRENVSLTVSRIKVMYTYFYACMYTSEEL